MNVESRKPWTLETQESSSVTGCAAASSAEAAKKVLILCHDFPPFNSVAALRPLNWLHTARQAGYEPVVVAMGTGDAPAVSGKPGGGLILRAKGRLSEFAPWRRAKSLLNRFTEHYTAFFDSRRGIYEQAAAYLKENRVAVIIACGEPFILFRYAWLLGKTFNIPYVLDYRDEWTADNLKSSLQRATTAWNRSFERMYLESALFYTSVSQGLVERIQKRTCCRTPGLTVANGVDLDLLRQIRGRSQSRHGFRLVYTGVVYDESYTEILREGLKQFLEQVAPKDFHLEFYGVDYFPNNGYRRLCALAAEYPQVVSIHPRVQPREALELQAGATALLSLLPGSQSQGIMGTKTYEYLASGRPSIVVPTCPDRRTHLFPDKGYQIFALNAEEFARELKALYEAHEAGQDLRTGITDAEIDSISRQRSSATLYSAIDQALHLRKAS